MLDNNEIYVVRNRFIDWQTLNRAQPAYDRLLTACEQYKLALAAQTRNRHKMERSMQLAQMYVGHFIKVLLMSVERGEIKKQHLPLYGFAEEDSNVPLLNTVNTIKEWGQKIIEGEKARLKKGGRPIYNPSIGMVSTHYDIFVTASTQQNELQERTKKAGAEVAKLRPEVDAILAKRNLGTSIADAPVVVAVGPGFTAGYDCHAVVETMRGHTLGRVYYEG